MKYDADKGVYSFGSNEMSIILDSLSYVHWNDKSLSESERNYIDSLFESLENHEVITCR